MQYISTKEISDELNVHRKTVLRWIRSGKLIANYNGNQYLIASENYKAFLEGEKQNINAHRVIRKKPKANKKGREFSC